MSSPSSLSLRLSFSLSSGLTCHPPWAGAPSAAVSRFPSPGLLGRACTPYATVTYFIHPIPPRFFGISAAAVAVFVIVTITVIRISRGPPSAVRHPPPTTPSKFIHLCILPCIEPYHSFGPPSVVLFIVLVVACHMSDIHYSRCTPGLPVQYRTIIFSLPTCIHTHARAHPLAIIPGSQACPGAAAHSVPHTFPLVFCLPSPFDERSACTLSAV
ncbi:hypothetical protein BD413DRAFT_260672 [Trametes elegans]|nr:hypothetical protein BD413DRAFT_260672 [Trametes elegans]